MRRTKFSASSLKIAVALLLLIALGVGCSQAPTEAEPENTAPRLLSRVSGQTSGASLSPAFLYVERVIEADQGGELSLFDVHLQVPAGAVSNDTLFSIGIPDPNVFYNEFGTDGLVFSKPVTVTMSYRDADLSGVDESTIRIAWFNGDSGEFEDVVCLLDTRNKTVTGELYHFSAYGLISD